MKKYLLIIAILAVALFLRVYKLDQIPPSLSWDEVANGYNAWSIANYGMDEWGNIFPVVFKSFEDDKHPVHIYLTAPFVKVMGLSEFSTRLPAALIGVLNVLMLYLLGRRLFKSEATGLLAALVLAISPYALQFSRFNHELNFALFFFLLGLWLFLKGIKEKNIFLSLSFLSFGLDLFAYQATLVVTPLMIGVLLILYIKEMWQLRLFSAIGLLILSMFIAIMLTHPAILGGARIKQNAFSETDLMTTSTYIKTHDKTWGTIELVKRQYLSHFSYKYLFVSGDTNQRHSTQAVGEFWLIDLPFMLLGLLALVKKGRVALLLLAWILVAPLPASLVGGAPHAARSLFLMGSMHLIIALGIATTISLVKKIQLKVFLAVAICIITGWSFYNYLNFYYNVYPKKSAIEWQYGMKQIVQTIKARDYSQVYMTEARSQPYIFFLYYLQTPTPDFHHNVEYNQGHSRPSSLVSGFNQYFFGGWDTVGSVPNSGVVYALTPSEYGGLRYQSGFKVVKKVTYPDGGDAYFVVTKP